MKKERILVLGLMALTLTGNFSGRLWAEDAAAGKTAFVDVAKVFDTYQKTKDNDQVLQATGKKKEEERETLVKEIRQMKDELVLLADDAKAKKQEELNNKVRALEEFDRATRQALGEQRNQVLREIFKDIDDTVKRYGERKGLEFVFNERALLYGAPKFDITQDIITELNNDFAARKKQ